MKFNNPDIIRITEIKQYLLDPPYSFKLHAASTILFEELTGILQKYPEVTSSFYSDFNTLRNAIEAHKNDRAELRNMLQEMGKLIGSLHNR